LSHGKQSMHLNLSVALITFNEEQKIGKTLAALGDLADEIIIVDSYSSDRTIEIAQSFGAKVECRAFRGFSDQKNYLLSLCSCDWVLLIDADEELSPALLAKIRHELVNPVAEVYECRFECYCFGRKTRFGGWSNFYKIRLFKRGVLKFGTEKVHEHPLLTKGATQCRLKEPIFHHTYATIEECLDKMNRYSSASAQDLLEKNASTSIFTFLASPISVFLKRFVLKLGFLDGFHGFVLAALVAHLHFSKYIKLRMLRSRNSPKK
jgi:glycosyltransferase involved in cell wall biosynthesis